MTQTAINYAAVLYQLGTPRQVVEDTACMFQEVPQLGQALASPVVGKSHKHRIIDRVFSKEIRNFLKVLCDHQHASQLADVFTAYHQQVCQKEGILNVTMYCVSNPGEEQLKKIKESLCKKHHKKDVELNLVIDPSLIGGFILRMGNLETDWSMKGRLKQLEQILIRR